MHRRRPLALTLLVLACAASLAACGSKDYSGQIARGDDHASLPLRGSLADDDGVLHDAAQAWLDRRGQGADGEDEGIPRDADLTALWAGHVPDRDIVVLRHERTVATIQRQPGGGGWSVQAVVPEQGFPDDGAPLGAGSVVLLPTGRQWRYWATDPDYYGGGTTTVDGLLVRRGGYGSDLEAGFVLPTTPARREPTWIYAQGTGRLAVDAGTLRRLTSYLDRGGAAALGAAVGHDGGDRPTDGTPDTLRLLWTGRVPGTQTALVTSESHGPRLTYASGSLVDQTPDGPSQATISDRKTLGAGRAPDVPQRGDRLLVGSAYIQTTAGPRLVLAGRGVRTLHALVGRRELTRPGPVAFVPAPWAAAGADQPDTVVFGRTGGGELVAPLARSTP